MNNICVYTCIVNDYDQLLEPLYYNRNIDYICYTDNLKMKSRFWNILSIPTDLRYLPAVLQQRMLKICPHRYLPEYKTSLWIDGNIQICKNLNQFIQQYDLTCCPLYTRVHPARNCIYKEARAVAEHGKADAAIVEKQIQKYRMNNYPEELGLAETGILLRDHNNRTCKLVCNTWAEEVLTYTHRDQLSFNYACWMHHFIYGTLTNELNVNNAFFKLVPHQK